MKTKQILVNEFNIEELENRFEMRTWVKNYPPGEIIS